ncbi:MAG: gamma-glutamyltransferase [Deltaproteobacteria bacterium]|nr:MAG: gamma-glutamyltransferase [Deltaproteobacteria bacterium]
MKPAVQRVRGTKLRVRRRAARLAVAVALLAAAVLAAEARAAARAPATGTNGMVASPQPDATRAGVEMLRAGGNAIDAAVATAFALSVTDPFHSGIGGGGFLLIRLADGRVIAIDARETAPFASNRRMFLRPGLPENASRVGALAVATPGLLAGLAEAQREFGTRTLADVLAPAIRLAEEGFGIGPHHARMLVAWRAFGAERFPETARIQLPAGDAPIEPGWRLVQTDLAASLRTIAREGPDVFYRGSLARAITEDVKRRGGILSLRDLEAYRAKRREPIRGSYRDYEVFSFPPSSSGGVALLEILNVVETFDLRERGAGSSASIHVIAEAMKFAFADRATYLGDADFVDVPVAGLTSKTYAADLRARINPAFWSRAPWNWFQSEIVVNVPEPTVPPIEDSGTSHLSVADAAGNAVAITQTINTLFGSGITVPGTGVVLNNQMDDFSVALNTPNVYQLVDTRGANAIAPGKRPLSSMTPTIVVRDEKPFMVTGSPGGPRIISTTLLTILNVVDYGMNVQEAVSAPRFHHQWRPPRLYLERAIPQDVIRGLRGRGHDVETSNRDWSNAQSIVIDPETGRFEGGSDPRGDGLALGY